METVYQRENDGVVKGEIEVLYFLGIFLAEEGRVHGAFWHRRSKSGQQDSETEGIRSV